jgi:hypothetical protein
MTTLKVSGRTIRGFELSKALPMPEPFSAIAPLLAALRSLPLKILIGLALAGWAILFVPPLGRVDLEPFRQQWGFWILIGTITSTAVSVAWIVDASVRAYWSHKRAVAARRVLHFVPLHQERWWHLAKQQDGSYGSTIRIDVQAPNISDHPVKIAEVRLLRPRAQLIHAGASLPMSGIPRSREHPVFPHRSEIAAVHMMVRGALAAQGKPIRVTIGLIDQNGEEYILPNLKIGTPEPVLPRSTMLERLRRWMTGPR